MFFHIPFFLFTLISLLESVFSLFFTLATVRRWVFHVSAHFQSTLFQVNFKWLYSFPGYCNCNWFSGQFSAIAFFFSLCVIIKFECILTCFRALQFYMQTLSLCLCCPLGQVTLEKRVFNLSFYLVKKGIGLDYVDRICSTAHHPMHRNRYKQLGFVFQGWVASFVAWWCFHMLELYGWHTGGPVHFTPLQECSFRTRSFLFLPQKQNFSQITSNSVRFHFFCDSVFVEGTCC